MKSQTIHKQTNNNNNLSCKANILLYKITQLDNPYAAGSKIDTYNVHDHTYVNQKNSTNYAFRKPIPQNFNLQ